MAETTERNYETLEAENAALKAEVIRLTAALAHSESQLGKFTRSLEEQSYFHNASMAAVAGNRVEQ